MCTFCLKKKRDDGTDASSYNNVGLYGNLSLILKAYRDIKDLLSARIKK